MVTGCDAYVRKPPLLYRQADPTAAVASAYLSLCDSRPPGFDPAEENVRPVHSLRAWRAPKERNIEATSHKGEPAKGGNAAGKQSRAAGICVVVVGTGKFIHVER